MAVVSGAARVGVGVAVSMTTVGVLLGPALAVAVIAAGLGVAVGREEGFPTSPMLTSRRHPGKAAMRSTLSRTSKVTVILYFAKMLTSQK